MMEMMERTFQLESQLEKTGNGTEVCFILNDFYRPSPSRSMHTVHVELFTFISGLKFLLKLVHYSPLPTCRHLLLSRKPKESPPAESIPSVM